MEYICSDCGGIFEGRGIGWELVCPDCGAETTCEEMEHLAAANEGLDEIDWEW